MSDPEPDEDAPREYTAEEIAQEFLDNVTGIAHYWANESRRTDALDKCPGTMFSLLVLLDGGSAGSPGFHVVPVTSVEDVEYYKGEGQNWYPLQEDAMDKIRGKLHDHAIQLHEVWSGSERYKQGRTLPMELDPYLQARKQRAGRLKEVLHRAEQGDVPEVLRLVRNMFDLLGVKP